ncbi:MAG: hypothetical protein OXF39_01630 [Nitrospira sp.]|nr:hypothetical protein [Nitrospira sp.]
MRKRKSVWFLILGLLIALAGCGSDGKKMMMAGNGNGDGNGDGNGNGTTMECPAGQIGTYPDCMAPPPPAPAGGHNAVIGGIVNPSTAGDPSTARPTTAPNRPGNAAGNAEAFNVTAGGLGTKPRTTIGTGPNGVNDLNLDQLDKDDMAGTPMKSLKGQFMNQDMDTTLGKFAGSVHQKSMGEGNAKTVDTLNVFTNIDAAKSETYGTYFSETNASNRDGVESATAAGVLTLSVDAATGMLSLFSGSKFPSAANQSFDTPADNTDTTAKENEFKGTFNGIAGTYACTASGGCSARTDAKSKLTLTGGWTFTPTESDLTEIKIPGVNYDSDYLSFGYWVRTTGEGDGTKYGVGTFYDGAQPIATDNRDTLVGEATYSGKAAGMYGRKTLDQYGQVESGSETSGHFTADAMLTARFGGDDIAVNKKNQIEGTVTNFMDGNTAISPNWTLKLNAAPISDVTTAFNGSTTGRGNWMGQFFGSPNAATTDDDKEYPTSVAGEFTGHFSNGHVIGAFGATKQ